MSLDKPLSGKRAIVTSGPTHEPIDPVRYIANKSSGKQGHAIAQALQDAGADVTLISGPVAIADPQGPKTIHVETAQEMLNAVQNALPADIAVFAAAVVDWRPKVTMDHKMKKRGNSEPPHIELVENPDILKVIGTHAKRPKVVVGFAAETYNVIENAQEKLKNKRADLILTNDVSDGKIFGDDRTHLFAVNAQGAQDWGMLTKADASQKLIETILTVTPVKAGVHGKE